MELSFIWVKSYRSLKELNISFSNEFDFFYDLEGNVLSKKQKTEISTKHFYGEKVLNLTAIIGENGVGKSSLFSLIRIIHQHLKDYVNRTVYAEIISNLQYIAIFKIGKRYYHFTNGGNLNLVTDIPYLPTSLRELENLFLLSYSNFYDYSSSEKTPDVIDISTTSLVTHTILELVRRAEQDGDVDALNNFQYLYKTTEIVSQLKFISTFGSYIPFPVPKQLSVVVRYEVPKERYLHPYDLRAQDEDTNYESARKILYEITDTGQSSDEKVNKELPLSKQTNLAKAIGALEHIVYRLERPLLKKYPKDQIRLKFKRLLQQAIIINFFEDKVFKKNKVADTELAGFNILKVFTPEKLAQQEEAGKLFVFVLDKVSSYLDIKLSAIRISGWIDEFSDLVTKKCEFVSDKDQLNIEIASEDIPRFKYLINQLAEFPFSPILDFYWKGISSGENAFITLFARIYQHKGALNKRSSALIYLLDECEVNFHPDWQRKLVKALTTILPEMLPLCIHQFIISSHSPLILSDIPRSNVIFLEKNDSKIRVSQLADRKQTFAANIHTLLSDAFFMKEGTIGDVAKEKINWVIDQINSRYPVFVQNLDEIKTIVDLIGEPVIRAKLATMMNEKLEINLYNFDTRLRDLERKSNK